MQKTEQKTHLK